MGGKNSKVLSTILCMVLLVTCLVPTSVKATGITTDPVMTIASDATGERTNLNFLNGNAGDTHLAYTYEQNGNTYKVLEDSTEDFKNVDSYIYRLNTDGNFVEDSTQHVTINDEGNPEITIVSADGESVSRTLDISSDNLQSLSTRSEWVTQYANGSRSGLKGLAISALVAVVAAVATYYSAGALTSAVVAGASAIASGLFNQNASTLYYYAIYNWRHSPKNYLVIDETEWTEFYLDSGHNYSLGTTYAEYIF